MAKKSSAVPSVPATPDPFPLLTYLDGVVDEMRGHVPRALREFDETAIHQARVGTRRLRAAIDLTGPVLGKQHRRPLVKVLRNLRRTLGPLRDLDVMIGRLNGTAADDPHAPAARWLATRLAAGREQARKDARSESAAGIMAKLGTWWGVRQEILEAKEAASSLVAASVHAQLDEFADDADHLTGLRPRDDGARQDPHELRIAGKALRYTLEMADRQAGGLPAGVGKSFKAMQELLGQWHDHVVLSERAMRVSLDEMLAHHDAGMQAQVCDLAKAAAEHAAAQLAEFGDLWRRTGADLANTIRAAFPLTTAIAPDPAPEPQPVERQGGEAPREASAEQAVAVGQ